MILRFILFLILNFAALGLGSLVTGNAVGAEWYQGLNKAPWTPPGWFFGVAWTTIMFCFTIYMTVVWDRVTNKNGLMLLYGIQLVLNVLWNPVFFTWHQTYLALVVITALTILMAVFLFRYKNVMGFYSLLILPYVLWLITATSLNAYVCLNN